MMLHEILRENLLKVVDKAYRSACFIYPDIPEKKKINASKYIGNNCSIDDIVAIVDATIFSNTKAGLLFSKTRFYAYFAGTKCEISYADIESIENEKYMVKIYDKQKREYVLNNCSFFDTERFGKLLMLIINDGKGEPIEDSSSKKVATNNMDGSTSNAEISIPDVFEERKLSLDYIMKTIAPAIVTDQQRFYNSTHIPSDKIDVFSKALKPAIPINIDDVLVFIDLSPNMTGKEGIVFTHNAVYLKDGIFKFIKGNYYTNIGHARYYNSAVCDAFGFPIYEIDTKKSYYIPENFVQCCTAIRNHWAYFSTLDVLIAFLFAGIDDISDIPDDEINEKIALLKLIMSFKAIVKNQDEKLRKEIEYVISKEREEKYSVLQNEEINKVICFEAIIHAIMRIGGDEEQASFIKEMLTVLNITEEDVSKAIKNMGNLFFGLYLKSMTKNQLSEEDIKNSINNLISKVPEELDIKLIQETQNHVKSCISELPEDGLKRTMIEGTNFFDSNPVLYEFISEKSDEDVMQFIIGISFGDSEEDIKKMLTMNKSHYSRNMFERLFRYYVNVCEEKTNEKISESIHINFENEAETKQLIGKWCEIFKRATDGVIAKNCSQVLFYDDAVMAFSGNSVYVAKQDFTVGAGGNLIYGCRYIPSAEDATAAIMARNLTGENYETQSLRFDLQVYDTSFVITVEFNDNGRIISGGCYGAIQSEGVSLTVENVFHKIGKPEYAEHFNNYIKGLYDLYSQFEKYNQDKSIRNLNDL